MTDEDAETERAAAASSANEVTLLDGSRVLVRPVLPSDREELEEGFSRLSEESRYFRFFSHLDHLTSPQLRYLTELDYHDHFALAAFSMDEADQPGVAVARYIRDPSRAEEAEVAVAVLDDYHGRGLGVALLRLLGDAASDHGIRRFSAYVLVDNTAMLDVFAFLGARVERDDPGVVRVELDLPTPVGADDRIRVRPVEPPDR